jgi:DNA processing protein
VSAGAATSVSSHERVLAAAAVTSLPAVTPQRLVKLARSAGDPADADWPAILADLAGGGERAAALASAALAGSPCGDARRLAARWTDAARAVDLAGEEARHREAGVRILLYGAEGYPPSLLGDAEAPAVLFARGAGPLPPAATVAIVGTRSATHYGKEVAAEFGAGLAARGVCVLSGLASGIDGAAHEGAVSAAGDGGAPPVAIVGAGLDVCYPAATAGLRRRLEGVGLVLGEAPLGAPPEGWRFPLRNRVIAGLAEVVVVVESHLGGGSLHTVEAALARGVDVLAVPGSIRSRASAGTNALLSTGAHPATCVDDIVVALECRGIPVGKAPATAAAAPAPAAAAAQLTAGERAVLEALESTPVSTDDILERAGLALGQTAMALQRLADAGLAHDCGGAWALGAPVPAGRR